MNAARAAVFATATVLLLPLAPLGGVVPVSGPIAANTTWTPDNVYVVNPWAVVNAGVTVTIRPGTVVKFGPCALEVYGALVAEGTAQAPIAFTSLKDDAWGGDTNADGAASVPAPGDWAALIFREGSRGWLGHATLACGGGTHSSIAGLVMSFSSDVRLDRATLEKSATAGLYAERASVSVTGCAVRDNASWGLNYVGLDPAIPLTVADNEFAAAGGKAGLYWGNGQAAAPATFRGNGASGAPCAFSLGGSFHGDILWDNGDALPMYIQGAVTVAQTGSLTLGPGSVVKSDSGVLEVFGGLFAQGSAGFPIAFTSYKNDARGGDTNGDGATTSPAPGDWPTLVFKEGSRGRIENASFSYGGGLYGWVAGTVMSFSSDVQLDQVVLEKSATDGLYAERASVRVAGSAIRDNGGYGLRYFGLDPAVPLAVTDNVFASPSGRAGQISCNGQASAPAMFRGNRSSDGRCAFSFSGTCLGDVRWDNGDALPIYLNNYTTIAPAATLTLMPGTVVKSSYHNLSVEGTLVAEGTPQEPVAFTSLFDDARGGDTNADGAATTPKPGDWSAVIFRPGSHGRMLHASVSYGGGFHEIHGSVMSWSSDVQLDHATLEESWSAGLWGAESGMAARHGSFTGSGSGAFNESTRLWIDARGNWWGDPSGPFHPTKNPSGKGQSVGDMVLFVPWAENPEGTVMARSLVVDGPSRAEAGETVEYAITYSSGSENLTDAVLVASLPHSANPEDCGGGTYLQETGEVFWLLGDLPPFSEGTRTVRVTYMWGTPRHFQDGLGGLLISRGMDTGAYTFDLDRYWNYTPISADGPLRLTDGEVQAELAAHAALRALHDRALSRGFTLLGGSAQSVDGVPYTMLSFASYALGSVAQLLRSRDDDRSILHTFGPKAFSVEDTSGALALDLELDAAALSGTWGAAAAGWGEADSPSRGVAFRNCLLKEAGVWAIGKVCKAFDTVTNGYKCTKGLLSHDAGDLGDCLSLIEKVGETLPIYGEIKTVHTCYWDTIVGGQVDKYACSGPLVKVEPPGFTWNPVSWSEAGRKRMYVKYSCNPTLMKWMSPVSLYCPPGWVAQDGADDGLGRPCVPANENVAFAYGDDDRTVPSRNRSTEVLVGGDPNAKYGPEGDILASDTVSYTVACENVGEGTAYGVFITDTLSDFFDDSSLSLGANGSYTKGSRMIFWDIGNLAPKGEPGSQAEVHFTAKLKAGVPSGTPLTNRAVVFFPSVPEETPTNSIVNTVATLIATPQSLAVTAGGSLPVTLAGRSAAGSPLAFRVTQPPLYGILEGDAPDLTYKPGAGFTGSDRFLFVAGDGTSESSAAEISVAVNPDPNDHTPPAVSRTSPAAGQTAGATASPAYSDATGPVYPPTVEVVFSEVMDASSITVEGIELRDAEGALVDRSVAYDAQAGACRITVRQPWSFGTHSATVGTGAKDLNGNPMAAPYTWTFTAANASGQAVPGDCNGDGAVTIGELQKAINMYLGTAAPGCGADCNGSGSVSIGELQKVINGFLGLPGSC